MPTYEYECKKCGHRFEALQSIKAEPLKKCPKCSSSLRRLIGGGAGFIFKGPGFYATDYKDKGKASGPKSCPHASKDNPSCGSCGAGSR